MEIMVLLLISICACVYVCVTNIKEVGTNVNNLQAKI